MSICSIPLTQLATHEVGLQDGRFLHFSTSTQEHIVGQWVENSVEENFKERLEWITQNVNSDWYFEMIQEHIGKTRMVWSFSNASDAMMFKLTWC